MPAISLVLSVTLFHLESRPLAHRKHLPLDITWDVLESRALGNSKLLGYILNKLDSETNGIYRF